MDTLKLGILGAGYAGARHAESIRNHPLFQFTSVFDIDASKASALAVKFGEVKVCENMSAFLDSVDAVAVCSPTYLHLKHAQTAVEVGKYCLIEKPLCSSVEEAAKFCQLNKAYFGQIATVSQHRYSPQFQELKRLIAEGILNPIRSINVLTHRFRDDSYYAKEKWQSTQELSGGGALITQGVHYVDIAQWLFSPINSVSAQKQIRCVPNVEGGIQAIIMLENGTAGILEASTWAFPGHEDTIFAYGDHFFLMIVGDRIQSAKHSDLRIDAQLQQIMELTVPSNKTAVSLHYHQYINFGEFIRLGGAPSPSVEEAAQNISAIAALYKSADKDGLKIDVPRIKV